MRVIVLRCRQALIVHSYLVTLIELNALNLSASSGLCYYVKLASVLLNILYTSTTYPPTVEN